MWDMNLIELVGGNRKDNLYINRNPLNHIDDGEPRALYWYKYRTVFDQLKDELIDGSEIPVRLKVVIVGKNNLRPEDFDTRNKDRNPLGGCYFPGKSAHIWFSDNLHEVCGAIFDRDAKRQDAMYEASVLDINNTGYKVFYAPAPNLPLHVRLVSVTHIENQYAHLPQFSQRKAICELFRSKKKRR